MRWGFHPEAMEEYRETTLYYAERDPVLALRFVEAVEDTIRRILESPERWRVLDEDVRRCLTKSCDTLIGIGRTPRGPPSHTTERTSPYSAVRLISVSLRAVS